jgi:murein DD-endopeptidase MepM/ murein hydrolase activator NlpD
MRDVADKKRLVAAAGMLCLGVAVVAFVYVENERSSLASRVERLRARLVARQREVVSQRQAMAAVNGAVDRLARASIAARDRAGKARRLARVEPVQASRANLEPPAPADLLVADEQTAHLLGRIGWVEEQMTVTGESVTVLAALVEDRTGRDRRGSVPSVWPVRGPVTSRFGMRQSPYGQGGEMHGGIDIDSRYGAPVAASGAGEVIFAGRDAGYGGLVVVAHPGDIRTLYAHLSAAYVRVGQMVRRGQHVGAVGASGRATGPHLHYEVRVAGVPVDPRGYLVN